MSEVKTRIAALMLGVGLASAGVLSAGMHSVGAQASSIPRSAVPLTFIVSDATPGADCAQDQADDSDANTENDEHDSGTAVASDSADNEQEDGDSDHAGADNGVDDANEGESGMDSEMEATAPAGQLSEGEELLPQATISLDQAVTTATGAAQGPLGDVELKDVNGTLVFEVQVGDQDVAVDATTGSVLSVDSGDADKEDGDCGDDAAAVPGALDDGAELIGQAAITLDQAVLAAQGAATGAVGEVDLEENDNGVLVFSVNIGDQEVQVDATTGAVIDVLSAED